MLMIIINKQGKHTTVPYARSRQILFPFALCVFFLFRFFVPYFFLCFLLLLFCSVDYSLFLFWFLFYLSSFFDSIVCEHFPMAYWLSLIAQSKKGDTKTSKINEKKTKYQQTNKAKQTMEFCKRGQWRCAIANNICWFIHRLWILSSFFSVYQIEERIVIEWFPIENYIVWSGIVKPF